MNHQFELTFVVRKIKDEDKTEIVSIDTFKEEDITKLLLTFNLLIIRTMKSINDELKEEIRQLNGVKSNDDIPF